jgi:hypothetical protein
MLKPNTAQSKDKDTQYTVVFYNVNLTCQWRLHCKSCECFLYYSLIKESRCITELFDSSMRPCSRRQVSLECCITRHLSIPIAVNKSSSIKQLKDIRFIKGFLFILIIPRLQCQKVCHSFIKSARDATDA